MILALSLGHDPSEFRCLPMELVERLDRHPDPMLQLHQIFDWYRRQAVRRENERLRDLERRARGGKDKQAQAELDRELAKRAQERGTTPQEEFRRLLNGHR